MKTHCKPYLIWRELAVGLVVRVQARHAVQVVLLHGEPRVAGLVVQLHLPLLVGPLGRDPVVLRHPHPAAHDVTGGRTCLHGEVAAVDDGQAPERPDVGALPQPAHPVNPLRHIVGALGVHLQLKRQLRVAQQKRRRGGAPLLQHALGLLDKDVQRVGVLLHEAKQVDVLPADLLRRLVDRVVPKRREGISVPRSQGPDGKVRDRDRLRVRARNACG